MTDLWITARTALKGYRHQRRRTTALRRWGLDRLQAMPAVLANAMPKSGSHLISQVLHGLPAIGPFVDPGLPPITRSEANTNLDDDAVLRNLLDMAPGDLRYGYVQAREPFREPLIEEGRAPVFVYRDPRDVSVSHVFYATKLYPGHGMHAYYTEQLDSMEQRIDAAIEGVTEPGFELSAIRANYDNYLAWLDQPDVLCLRFEDLIHQRETALNRILDYLETRGFDDQPPRDEAVATLASAIQPGRSGTFRKGGSGDWRNHFTEHNKAVFRSATGDLLQRLGYEDGEDW